jgi:hypothetical protein
MDTIWSDSAYYSVGRPQMSEPYKELSRRAIKGDANALRELFTLAEQREGEKNFHEAAVAFREAAIAYRISTSRNLGRAEHAESRAAWLSAVRDIYKRWIEANPSGLRELPYRAPGVTHECIRHVVVGQLLHEESFAPVFLFLEESLSAIGMEFSSPGGSIQRRVCWLLGEVFGLEGSGCSEYLRNSAVRVGLDLLADEVEERCGTAQLNAPQAARP